MSSFETWLHPLRAYPRGFVLVCFVLTVGPIIWGIAKMLKWSVYTVMFTAFAGVTGGFVLWLWG